MPALLLLWACFSGYVHAAQPSGTEMHFQRLGADAGVSQGSVMAIAADASGFLWLGTEDGLNRYDGGEMLHFLRDRSDPRSLPSNWIAALATDPAGRLWIGTDGGGVVWRGADHEGFRRPVSTGGRDLLDPQSRVRLLHPDSKGRMWVGTRGEGLYVVDLKAGTAHEYRHDPADAGSLSDDAVFAVDEHPDGSIWIGTQRGLDRMDPVSGRVTRVGAHLQELTGGNTKGVLVTDLHVDRRGMVWIGTPAGLARFDATADRFTLLRHEDGDASTLPDNRVTAIFEDDAQRLWVGTAGGLALLDPRTDAFASFRHDPADPSSLPDSHIVTIFQDRTGLLWFGTKSGGAASWNPRSWSFGHRRVGSPAADNVAAFAEDSHGTLWVGSYGGGLMSIDHHNGRIRHLTHDAADAGSIGDDYVMALLVDGQNRIWYGTMTAGLERLDPATGKIKRFVYDRNDPRSLAANGVMSLFRDSRDRIWVGTYGGGACVVDTRDDAVSCYPVQPGDAAGLSSDRATAIAEDNGGLIWVGTDGGGLNVIDPVSGRIASFRHDPTDPKSLSADTVYAVHLDERGQLWVGTRGGGLDRVTGQPFGTAPLRFRNYSETDGLPNSTVYGIESDNAGFLWLSTNRGLARFDPRTERFHSVRESHGLQGDEFNFGAHYRSPAGMLYFGGPNGFNAFFPERLRFNELPPPVVLTAFQKFNVPAALGTAPERLQQVALDYRDDVITFRFAALDFAAPRENRYAYMLEGFDQDWVDAGNARQATYTNLAGGKYVFRVKASNSDGRWNEAGISLPISVAQPPWLRWWAFLLYAGTLALALFAVWAAQQRKLAREAAYARQLEQQVAERTEEIGQRNHELQLANERLTEASLTDPLTRLGNRRCLRTVVDELFAQTQALGGAAASGPCFVMMIVDLDRLKPINDQFGHEAGDRVLVQVADTLRQVCRSTDRIFRWGGDEFVVLCSDTDLDKAATLAERIRYGISKQIFRAGDRMVARTSCSIGFAPYPFIAAAPDLVHWEQSLAFADAALYQAKVRRNQWIGWAGTARAVELADVAAEIERDAARLEAEGILDVRRRPEPADETVDRLRALGGPSGR